ncbi:uncharacterized protein SPAPADRAFT_141177 [Spathaspora passalidarum NRRL Y-27907]|uniref:F-box domain-containing protein n=1 Tax=Spathaspora passalidarum (strain NRRL Y-27907 / 11-Y1) TaxID=619300 RepID=G3AQH6_SPAPN|nr:uncharacterized protein SPAPADRAFT_141177 [Spathaspora passalidarum NRRL Y-27907]EGW31523.1 hypothetical protein SPAPADRAFT_141177 [Spathaspora passalidarum NRRL Y-27907]
MKRKQEEEGLSHKFRKTNHELSLLNIPDDVLNLILSHLSLTDVIHLSCLDRAYRSCFSSRIFTQVKAPWSKLIEAMDSKENFIIKHKNIIRQLRIIDSYSYGEWQIDFFTDLLINIPNLKRLLINSKNSSNWIKYRGSDNIEQLSLYFEEDSFNLIKFSLPNAKQGNFNSSPRIFRLDHVANFKMLTKLSLTDYHFNWEVESVKPVLMIHDISLHNCSWEYPFKLSQFNYNDNIKKLKLTYSNQNPFLLSERFNTFLNDDYHEDFKSLEELAIDITFDFRKQAWSKFLSNRLILRFYNRKDFPNLRQLTLHGWYFALQNFKETIKNISCSDSDLYLLDLKVFDSVNDCNLIPEIKQEWKQLCVWKKLKLEVL